jgi:hypothetical protein
MPVFWPTLSDNVYTISIEMVKGIQNIPDYESHHDWMHRANVDAHDQTSATFSCEV